MKDTTIAWTLVLAAGVNSCIGNVLLKRSRVGAPEGIYHLLFSPWFIGGLAFYGVNVILFAKALDQLPVSRAYPVLAGFGFLLVVLASRALFQERFDHIHWAGLAAVLVGIWCLSR
ncbi:DMT family transporter [Xanthomonas sacchari]|uniref:DMT family transporter n=1 Tax=Xanthomonas sacchari TaxID=56458 RepID=UPI00225DF12A|nr:SMR family transporter [Xanthomonas sacchari]